MPPVLSLSCQSAAAMPQLTSLPPPHCPYSPRMHAQQDPGSGRSALLNPLPRHAHSFLSLVVQGLLFPLKILDCWPWELCLMGPKAHLRIYPLHGTIPESKIYTFFFPIGVILLEYNLMGILVTSLFYVPFLFFPSAFSPSGYDNHPFFKTSIHLSLQQTLLRINVFEYIICWIVLYGPCI